MNRFFLIIVLFSLSSCSIDSTIFELSTDEEKTLISYQNIEHKSSLKIAPVNEPGEKLMLCLTFIDNVTKQKISNQLVKFYHTSSKGDYEQENPNDESTARLHGQAITNHKGQIFVETILPGDYGSSSNNRHIHTSVFNAKPEAYDIHFKQYISYFGANFVNGSDQHFLADLKKTKKIH